MGFAQIFCLCFAVSQTVVDGFPCQSKASSLAGSCSRASALLEAVDSLAVLVTFRSGATGFFQVLSRRLGCAGLLMVVRERCVMGGLDPQQREFR